MSHLPAVAEHLRAALGPRVGIGLADPSKESPPLWPEETPGTERMLAPRLNEFAAGRAAARAAMEAIGLPPAPVPLQADRAPEWPRGLVGSISHNARVALALVARAQDVAALGVDLEDADGLDPDLWETILAPEERRWLASCPAAARAHRAQEIFCAKEAVHKLHHPRTGEMLSFEAVTVTLQADRFEAALPQAVKLSGQILRVEGLLIATLAALPGALGTKTR